jgi:hypothetical protein
MSKTTGVTATTMAVHLGLSQPRIAQLVAEAVIPKRPDGRFGRSGCPSV